jgi:hypothetical protein
VSTGFGLELVVLVPGKDDEEALIGLLATRCQSLRIRPPRFKVLRHPRRDAGCFREAERLLRPFLAQAEHALVMFDYEGCGQESRSPDWVSSEVRERLQRSGWDDRAEVVVVVPELEAWVWSDSPRVDDVLGWHGREPCLRSWLQQQGLWQPDVPKPSRPKEAVERALEVVRLQRSSATYRQLAESVSLQRCQDTSFRRLVEVLRQWFSR